MFENLWAICISVAPAISAACTPDITTRRDSRTESAWAAGWWLRNRSIAKLAIYLIAVMVYFASLHAVEVFSVNRTLVTGPTQVHLLYRRQ